MRRSPSSTSLSWGQDSTRIDAKRSPGLAWGFALRSNSTSPAYRAGATANRFHTVFQADVVVESELLGTDQFAVSHWVEAIVGLAPAAQRLEATGFPEGLAPLGVGEPGQQVVHRIIDDQSVEVLAGQGADRRLGCQVGDGDVGKLLDRPPDRPGGGRVPTQPQADPAPVRLEERRQGPVLAVGLGEEDAPVLQFGQGPEFRWAVLGRPQGWPADAWQIEERDGVGGPGDLGDAPARAHRTQMAGPVRLSLS